MCIGTYTVCAPGVCSTVKATLTQTVNSFSEKLREAENTIEEDGNDVLADFKTHSNRGSSIESVQDEVVAVLKFLLDKIDGVKNVSPGKQAIPLLLEGVQAMLVNLPSSIRHHQGFQNLVWQQLCPALIWLLGSPKAERSTLFQRSSGGDEVGRGSGLMASLPPTIIGPAAKNIYNIASELIRLVGNTGSLRPVLESLFHRILLYPAPQYRHDALKVLQEVLGEKEMVVEMTAPLHWEPGDKNRSSHTRTASTALIKLMVDSLQECSRCGDTALCHMAVGCVDRLLQSLEAILQGQGVPLTLTQAVLKQLHTHGLGHTDRLEEDGGSTSQPTTPVSKEPAMPGTSGQEEESRKSEPPSPEKLSASDRPQADSAETNTSLAPESSETESEDESQTASVDVQASLQSRWDSEHAHEMSRRQHLLQDQFERIERKNARHCVTQLQQLLPALLDEVSILDVDDKLQEFASSYCPSLLSEEGAEEVSAAVVLNADGVYSACVTALSLSLQLHSTGFYSSQRPGSVPMSEAEFVEDIVGSGLLVYLSPAWLTEVYRQVLAHDLLDCTSPGRLERAPLLALLKDMDGVGSHEERAQMLSQFQEEDEAHGPRKQQSSVAAGRRLARCVLAACWEGLLEVLAVLLTGKNQQGISASLALLLGMEGAKEDSLRARDAVCLSLNALQRAARLCSALGLQEPCSSVFALLAKTSCSSKEEERGGATATGVEPKSSIKTVLPSKSRLSQLHAAHVLSLDVVMTTGLEMGSHSATSWKHVFRCCEHISELEHSYFSQGNNQTSLPQLQPGAMADSEPAPVVDSCEDELYSGIVTPAVPVAPRISVAELIRQSSLESGWDSALTGGSLLTHAQASRALCALSQEVDSFFEDAAAKLNMTALLSFLAELGEASRQQLRRLPSPDLEGEAPPPLLPTNALLLSRLQHVLTNLVNSHRPLLHLLRAWAVIGPYLVEASAYRDWSISKMAATCIHDFIVVMLSSRDERPHFHVNEFLCKTFEDILGLQLCDGDVQDQIVCSICELVEACSSQIQSGWRPLFGALRSVKIEYTANEEVNEARQRHVAAVLDVFEVYLNTDNVFVFCNATVDCILCLLKYIHGSGMFEDMSEDESDSDSEVGDGEGHQESLVLPALQYLQRCAHLLSSMWNMPACPVLKGAHRIQMLELRLVDTVLPGLSYEAFTRTFHCPGDASQEEGESSMCHNDSLSLDSGMQDAGPGEGMAGHQWQPLSLEQLDRPSGVLHVWLLLLDGLATAASACPRHFQSHTLDCLFQMLTALQEVPGPEFAVYCVNHLLLPMLQSWLRRGARQFGYWDSGAVNFKQCCGLTADLVVDHLHKFSGTKDAGMLEFMLHQLFAVLIECIAQPVESLSRLGCSCIRHVLVSGGAHLTEPMWQVGVQSLRRAVDVSTCPVRLLMMPFHSHSDNFYGDIGHVKVATRKDCSLTEYMRMQALAQQVFLLESQVQGMPAEPPEDEEAKSFIFLLYPPSHSGKQDTPFTRMPFRDIILGLLSHQLLLQTIGFLLLEPGLAPSGGKGQQISDPKALPGYLPVMSVRNAQGLLEGLDSSYRVACEFDARPGLKFLVQKVAGLQVAANLYKQAGASVVYYTNTLVKVCSGMAPLSLEDMHRILAMSPESWMNQGQSTSTPEGKTQLDSKQPAAESPLPNDSSLEPDSPTQAKASTDKSSSCQSTSSRDPPLPKASSEAEASKSSAEKPPEQYVVEALSFRSRNWAATAQECRSQVSCQSEVFLHLLQSVCLCLCQSYVDILADKTGASCLDSMADQPLLFLIAQPDDLTDITKPKLGRGGSQESGNREQGGVFATAACPVDSQLEAEMDESIDETVSVSSDDGDDSPTGQRSKRELREEQNSKVYTIATDKLIKTLMTQYKQRKQQHSMPGFVKVTKRQRKKSGASKPRPDVDEVIDKQQRSSTMKDSEAHAKSWAEMLCSVLQLFLALPAPRFTALLPAVFPSITQLVAHAQDPRLRDTLADWFARLGDIHGFVPGSSKPKVDMAKQ